MKKYFFVFLVFSVLGCSFAQAELKICTLNVNRCLLDYYKAQDSRAKLESMKDNYESELNKKKTDFEKKVAEFRKKQQEIADNPGYSDQAKREHLAQLAETEGTTLEQEQTALEKYGREKQTELNKLASHEQDYVLSEIKNVANKMAIENGVSIILDSTEGKSVFYVDRALDITEKVIKELNKDQPNN